jgi:hypothetical protein
MLHPDGVDAARPLASSGGPGIQRNSIERNSTVKKSKSSAKKNKRTISRSAEIRIRDLMPKKEPKGGISGVHYKKVYIEP